MVSYKQDVMTKMIQFLPISGRVTEISDFTTTAGHEDSGCTKFITVTDAQGGTVNFIVSPTTYVVDQALIQIGDWVTGYFDGNAPVPLIYPPQYHALVMVKINPPQHVKVDFFNSQLVSHDGQLKINLSPFTQLLLTNGQSFTGDPANRNWIVLYSVATKSIPAQTSPYRMILLCH
ncbi:hypothetical protein JOC27_000284 [Sporolactobacillus spathodeae]|uniref:Uncharacterized protein n=2 Tax=Sporolactobacillus spathodeae TaxID=1465502 RepID=A0ABS2Q777_9BACL|nr:hypothetical protein [Sporolactobacillus spathodeae]